MALEIKPLVYFTAALTHGSVQGAADALGVRASTVSRAIAGLEYALATKLVVRRTGGIVPSLEGAQLNRTAAEILAWCAALPQRPRSKTHKRRDSARVLLDSPLSLRTLSQFCVVIEEGSISSAARRLNITQPTLSRRIAELEAFIGTSLLMRDHTGARPTELARTLYTSVAAIEALAKATTKRANVGFLHRVRDIRLGAVMPAGVDSNLAALLARIIKDSAARDRARSVSVSSAPAQELMEQLLAGVIDAAIVDTPDVPDLFMQMEIGRRPLYLVTPVGATSAGDTVESVLKRLPLALPMTGTGLRHATDHLFGAPGTAPRTIECGSIPVLIRLVIEGTCCAIIPGGSHPRKDPRLRSFVLPDASLVTSLIWTRAKTDSAQVIAIRDLVKRQKFG